MSDKKKEESKTSYGLFVLRRNEDHISVLETDNYDEAYEAWETLKQQWAKCINESLPFELTSPVVTAFDPNLIYEIILKPVVETMANNSRNFNPYKQAMHQNGLQNTLGNHAMLSEIKDGGYR